MLKRFDFCFALLMDPLPLVRLRSSLGHGSFAEKWEEQNQNIGEELESNYEKFHGLNIWNKHVILICECIMKLEVV